MEENSTLSTIKTFIPLEDLALNPGLSLLLKQILSNLNAKEISFCRLVSKTLRIFIDGDKKWWILQLNQIRNKTLYDALNTSILYRLFPSIPALVEIRFPEWKVVNEHFAQNEAIDRLKSYISYMRNYVKDFKRGDIMIPMNPLFYATTHGHDEFIELLIDTPIDFNDCKYGWDGRTVIHHACITNQLEILKLLVRYADKKHLSFEARHKYGETPFHHALRYSSLNCFKVIHDHLRSKQFDLLELTPNGQSIFHLAASNQNVGVIQYVYNEFFKENPTINIWANGWTPLHQVCYSGSLESLEFILKVQPDLGTITQPSECGEHCFHIAARSSESEALKYFLTSNLITNQKICDMPDDEAGQRSIHKAAYWGILGNVKLLFEYFGPKYFDEGDHDGNTPLHLASDAGEDKVIEFLLEKSDKKSFDINKVNNLGQTAEDCVRSYDEPCFTRSLSLLKSYKEKLSNSSS